MNSQHITAAALATLKAEYFALLRAPVTAQSIERVRVLGELLNEIEGDDEGYEVAA